jgi:hypothetical protein
MGADNLAAAQAAAERYRHPLLSLRPSAALRAAVQRLAGLERRSTSQMLVLLAEEALGARGLWPPAVLPREG